MHARHDYPQDVLVSPITSRHEMTIRLRNDIPTFKVAFCVIRIIRTMIIIVIVKITTMCIASSPG